MQYHGNSRIELRRRKPQKPRFSLKRLTIFGAVGLTCLAATYLFFTTGSGTAVREWGRERVVTLAANMGYRVQNIYVEGRNFTEPDLIKGIVNVGRGDPLFNFDPATARDLLRKVSWVKDVTVQRQLPNSIYIHITERQPIALWQHEGRVRVIDADGVVLTSDLKPFESLPLVVGVGANERVADLMKMIDAEPSIKPRLEAASWVGERRWDLKMKDGLIVKLPEDDVGLALKKLADSQSQDKLLDKDIALVDLREADRFVIRTKPGAVQEYKARFAPGPGGDI